MAHAFDPCSEETNCLPLTAHKFLKEKPSKAKSCECSPLKDSYLVLPVLSETLPLMTYKVSLTGYAEHCALPKPAAVRQCPLLGAALSGQQSIFKKLNFVAPSGVLLQVPKDV